MERLSVDDYRGIDMTATTTFDGARLLSIAEGSKALGCHPSTVYRMYDAGEIALQPIRGRRMIPVSEIERLTQGTRKAVEAPVREPAKLRFLKRKLFPKVVK